MAIDVPKPRAGTPKDDPAWERYWDALYERTGGENDAVAAAQSTAEQGVSDAATAQDTANSASPSVEVSRLRFINMAL